MAKANPVLPHSPVGWVVRQVFLASIHLLEAQPNNYRNIELHPLTYCGYAQRSIPDLPLNSQLQKDLQ
jgi:hypothetical protein